MRLSEIKHYRKLDWVDWEQVEDAKTRELESERNKEIARLIKIKAGSVER
jgi:hypothetical protein